MNRFIYLLAFLILITGDAIIGYKSAVTDFRIEDPAAAIAFCLAFAFLSVPAKLIFDRLVEAPYKAGVWYGKIPFIFFAVAWCALAYKSYEGITRIRQNSLKVSQLQNFGALKIQAAPGIEAAPKSELEYKYLRYKEFKRAKLDSIQVANAVANNNRVLAEAIREAKNIDVSGLFWFNLLLIISGAVALSMFMNAAPLLNPPKEIKPVEYGGITARHNFPFKPVVSDSGAKTVETPGEEPKAPETGQMPPKSAFHVICKDCGEEYLSKQAYAGHFNKKGSICKKGNVERL